MYMSGHTSCTYVHDEPDEVDMMRSPRATVFMSGAVCGSEAVGLRRYVRSSSVLHLSGIYIVRWSSMRLNRVDVYSPNSSIANITAQIRAAPLRVILFIILFIYWCSVISEAVQLRGMCRAGGKYGGVIVGAGGGEGCWP